MTSDPKKFEVAVRLTEGPRTRAWEELWRRILSELAKRELSGSEGES